MFRRIMRWLKRDNGIEECIDSGLMKLRDRVYNTPSLHDDSSYRKKFLEELFDSTRQPDGREPAVKELVTVSLPPDSGANGPAPSGKDSRAFTLTQQAPAQPSTRGSGTGWGLGMAAAGCVFSIVLSVVLWPSGERPAEHLPMAMVTREVAYLPVVDSAPFLRALDENYFRDEGLDIKAQIVRSGPDAVRGVNENRFSFGFSSYPGFFVSQIKKTGDLRIVNAAYTATGDHLVLMGPPDRSFTSPAQAAGKRIAVTSRNSISDLGAKAAGLNDRDVKWLEMGMPEMVDALVNREIDGAVVAEPYVTILKRQFNAWSVLDVTEGDTDHLPMSGWGVSAEYARTHMNEVRAFQRAMQRGARDLQDIKIRNAVIVKHFDVPPEIALHVQMGIYPTELEPAEIQRLATILKEKNIIAPSLDVNAMLLPEPKEQN